MATLVGYLDPAEDAPGFLLPLFQVVPGANLSLTQVVGQDDEVIDFIEIAPPAKLTRWTRSRVSIEVGAAALWAFKDHRDTIHLGNVSEMRAIAVKLLRDSSLMSWPLVRLELGSFRDRLADHELLQAAFASVVEDGGDDAAQVWRDTEVFAPAFRRDALRSDPELISAINAGRMLALFGERLNIFVDPSILSDMKAVNLEETRHVLKAFGLPPEVRFRSLAELERRGKRTPVWRICGIGGVARYVVKARPFAGRPYRILARPSDHGIEANGSIASISSNNAPESQFIAICQSIEGQVEAMATEVMKYSPETFVRHLVNVRPFNFGSPPPRKTSVGQLPAIARNFDHTWIIAGHRQRQTGSYRNQLSVTNAASRLVRNLAISVIRRSDLLSQITHDGMAAVPSLNLFGVMRSRIEWSEIEAVRRLLHTMLCEEAMLHTADRIIVLTPYDEMAHVVEVRLGERKYLVEIVPDRRDKRSNEMICWALSVKISRNMPQEFSGFCIGLMDGYGWDYRGISEGALLFEDEGEALRVWPAHDLRETLGLISESAPSKMVGDVIVTPQTITREWVYRAEEMGWNLIHYSELPRWLGENYINSRFSYFEDDVSSKY